MAIVKDIPSLPFGSGTEYLNFKYNYCDRCKNHKEREDGFPVFPEDGGCPIEDAMENARFNRGQFPNKKIRKLIDSDGDVAKFHHCMEFKTINETREVNKMSELKRCPFCGQKMIPSHKLPKHPNGYLKWMRFHPDNKCILSAFCIDLRETEWVKEWNTRKPMQNIVERLEAENYIKDGGELFLNRNLEDCIPLIKVMKIVKEEGEISG